jgi:hypothetical protein
MILLNQTRLFTYLINFAYNNGLIPRQEYIKGGLVGLGL